MKFQVKEQRYTKLFEHIRMYFEASKVSVHKARNEIKIISYDNTFVVVKSFKIPNIFNRMVYTFFRDSKAKKSYDNSIKIIDFVPNPIGYIEFRKFGFIYDSYFVSEKFEYDFTIREPLLDTSFRERDEIFKQFALFTYVLHENNIFHLDYSPGNILIKKEKNAYIFKIVDINRMQFKDLEIIIKEYAQLINTDEKKCIDRALAYSQKHKDKKNFKKRLKGQKVVD